MVASDDASRFQLIEGAANRGKRAAEARGQGVKIGVFMFANITRDEVDTLLVGHGADGCLAIVAQRQG